MTATSLVVCTIQAALGRSHMANLPWPLPCTLDLAPRTGDTGDNSSPFVAVMTLLPFERCTVRTVLGDLLRMEEARRLSYPDEKLINLLCSSF